MTAQLTTLLASADMTEASLQHIVEEVAAVIQNSGHGQVTLVIQNGKLRYVEPRPSKPIRR